MNPIIKFTKRSSPLLQQKKALLLFIEVMLPSATHSTLISATDNEREFNNYKKGMLS
jgi:hypothetical protein